MNDINLTGGSYILASGATTVAVDIDASALTGSTAVASTALGLKITGGAMVAGSVVTGSDFIDNYTLGAEGTTYKGGAGADLFTTTIARITNDGSTDSTLSGGLGIDTLTISDTTTAMTDNQFTNITGMEKRTLTNTTGDATVTTGAAFNTAFADGATIVTGTVAVTKDVAFAGGLATVATNLTVVKAGTGVATETDSIVTGSADDTVTVTAANFVGVAAAAQGSIVIDTNAGDDTISVTLGGTLLQASSGSVQALSITGGAGKDLITVATKVNGAGALGAAIFTVATGDSTVTNYDEITGFDTGITGDMADGLEFGTSTIGTLGTSTDFGTILDASVTNGVATFDDAATFATALIINSSNLADVVGYLAANSSANEAFAFIYDNTGDGSADSTMVYHNGTTDDMVMLAGTVSVAALVTTNAVAVGNLFVS